MKRILIIAAAVAALVVISSVLTWLHFRSQRPEILLKRLLYGKGDPQELIMRLNVARGDNVTLMIEALQDKDAPATGRANVLELLFKRNFRASEPRIERTILTALKDPHPIIRRKGAYGLAVYCKPPLQVALAGCVTDPDPEVRRQAYLALAALAPYDAPERGIWELLSDQQKEKLVEVCLERMKTEEDNEMRILARSIVGREIEVRAFQAIRALQSSDVAKAEKILRQALELHPENQQAQMRLIRFFLKTGEKEKALELAKKYGALIEIPTLSQAPEIDGDPTDAAWDQAYATDTFYRTSSRWAGLPAEGKSKAFLGHRDGTIYIAIIAYEKDLDQLVLKHRRRDSPVWQDDCVEIAFDPGITEKNYFKFTINALNALMDKADGNNKRDFPCRHSAAIFRDRGYWACEFAIKGEDMKHRPIRPGVIWSMNLFRARIGAASEHSALWPPFGQAARMELYPIAAFR